MLPKRISPQKEKQIAGQQLELEDNLSRLQKSKKKRRALLIGLALTIGLSIFFSLFRFSRQLSFNLSPSLPSFFPSSLNLSPSPKLDLKKPVFSLLENPDLWKIYVTTLRSPDFSWSHLLNPSTVTSSVTRLSSLPPNSNSLVSSSLPQGTIIQDNLESVQDPFIYQVLISVPGQQIYIQIEGPDQTLIGPLVETIYWQVIKNTNSS
jgi:hypothetical protein